MATQTTADGGRTETDRFETDVDASDLTAGDRIDPAIVARVPEQLGDAVDADRRPETDRSREYQLAAVTSINSYDDVHSALLVDAEAGLLVRASRHDSQQAWSQAEADWTVREAGDDVSVTDVHEVERADGEDDETDEEYAQTWIDILVGGWTAGNFDFRDERELNGDTLTLRDADGRKVVASVELTGADSEEGE